MEKHIYDEKNGLHYTLAEDGMHYPDLALPEGEDIWMGKLEEQHLLYQMMSAQSEINLF